MTLPNIITFLRLLLIIPFSLSIKFNYDKIALFLFLIASVSDFLDGYLARKYNSATLFGRLLDPLADKILYLSSIYLFLELDYINSISVVVIFIRELLATAAGPFILIKNFKISSIFFGRLKNVFQFLSTCIIIFTKKSNVSEYLIIFSSLVTVISIILIYVQNIDNINENIKKLNMKE